MFTNKHSYDFYLEKYESIKLKINPTDNPNGILYSDEFGNQMYSPLNVGISKLTSLFGYSFYYPNSLLIYNENNYILCKDYSNPDEKLVPIIHPNVPTFYKIDAKLSEITNLNDNSTFTINLTGRSIFKVKLNGKFTTNFTVSANGVVVGDVLDPFENTLEVIHYKTDQTILHDFYFTYEGVKVRYDLNTQTCNSTFFDDMSSLNFYVDFSDGISKTLTDVGNSRMMNSNKETANSNNTINLTIQDGRFDLIDTIDGSKFRLLAYSTMDDKLIYWTDCSISAGIGFTIGTETNNKNIIIDFDDRIEVYGNNPVNRFGEGTFGNGLYSLRAVSANYGTVLL